MASATHIKSLGAAAWFTVALGPCLSQNLLQRRKKKILIYFKHYSIKYKYYIYPVSFMTEVSPQSQAPPAWLRNILKSWLLWFPFLKHSVQSDIQGEMPHVRHLYATKFGVHTKPHVVALSYILTKIIIIQKKINQLSAQKKKWLFVENYHTSAFILIKAKIKHKNAMLR